MAFGIIWDGENGANGIVQSGDFFRSLMLVVLKKQKKWFLG